MRDYERNSFEDLDVQGHPYDPSHPAGSCEDLGDGECPWWPVCEQGEN